MTCFLALCAICAPRVTILLLVFTSDVIGNAFASRWVPFVGFLFVPLSTLTTAWQHHVHGGFSGMRWGWLALAMGIDLGILGGGPPAIRRHRRKRDKKRRS